MLSGASNRFSKDKNRSLAPTRKHNRLARFLVFAVSIPIIALTILADIAYGNLDSGVPPRDPEIFLPAISAYRHDCINRGEPILNEVSLTQLTRWGYIKKTKTEKSNLDEIYFTTSVKSPLLPQAILCRAEFLDGEQIVLLGDGSVQRFSAERFKSLTGNTEAPSPFQEF